MPLNVKFSQKRFAHGISDYLKEDATDNQEKSLASFVMAKAVNYRTDPQAITLLPGAVKESASVVTDLIKWGDTIPTLTTYYFYGNTGNIYKRTSVGAWTNLHTAPSSHGNGLAYFTGDDYLYYTTDLTIGRYGPVSGSSPQFSDNFLLAQGGAPTNTNSVSFVSASSQYLSAADSASLSVTSDITLEAYFKATTLPSSGNSMTLIGKWDESGTLESYKMDLYGGTNYFGSGADGSLTISSNTTEAPIDSAATATAGTTSISATNVSFAAGQVILVHQSQGTNAGQWERNTIASYSAGTITTGTALLGSYVSGAQVRVMKQYSAITVQSGKIWTAKSWNGTVGGILANLCSGTITVSGTISASSAGFRGSSAGPDSAGQYNYIGEGTTQAKDTTQQQAGAGGGGGSPLAVAGGGGNYYGGSGGGSNATAGGDGTANSNLGGTTPGLGATQMISSADLTTMTFGGGAGTAGVAVGADGGGIIFLTGVTLTVTGAIVSNGDVGATPTGSSIAFGSGQGGGAGGSILLKAQTATLGSGLITATGGAGGAAVSGSGSGGAGGNGRVVLNYSTSYTGTTTPTLNAILDNTLAGGTTPQARFGVSANGTTNEYLTVSLPSLSTGVWNRLSVSWVASTSTASFYLNGLLVGTSIGTRTAIHDNTSLCYVGANKGASAVQNFFNGLIDDVRVWGAALSAATIFSNYNIALTGSEGSLKAYWKLDNALTDSTGNSNTLTNHSTTFSTDVPFSGITTRLDQDLSFTVTGQTYSVPTAISEASTDTLTFTPVNDPQKSIALNINAKGTGSWTVTIHDQQNNVVATQTIANANMISTGYQEFVFTTPWRIITGRTYHAHVTVSTGTSSVVTSVASDFSTADFYTYFGILVTDTAFHPITTFLNFIAIGNERYIATWDGASYTANKITFPPGWRVRCFGYWREYLAIGVWKGTNIYDYPKGRVYFWDGVSATFNFFIDVGEGQINALFGLDSDLYMVAGYRIYLYDYAGGFFYNTGNTKSNLLKRLPNNQIPETDAQEVFPGAITMWRSLVHIGLNAVSNSTTVERGVYSYGTFNKDYPDTLSYDYPISTGNTGSTVSIGCVYPAGKQLIIGWQDGISFGADVIDFANAPAPTGYIQLLAQDDGAIWKEKSQLTIRADYKTLASGEGVTVGYKIDRATNWTNSAKAASTDSTPNRLQFNIDGAPGRGREYQLRADLYATGSTSPTLLGVSLLGDVLPEEEEF